MPDPLWLIAFKVLLCRMYREWGGDCNSLPQEVTGQVATLVSVYQSSGDPPLANGAAVQAFLGLLTDVEDALNQPGNTLGADDDAAMRTLIADLRTDLSPALN
jgi:hypothetical protein